MTAFCSISCFSMAQIFLLLSLLLLLPLLLPLLLLCAGAQAASVLLETNSGRKLADAGTSQPFAACTTSCNEVRLCGARSSPARQ